MPRRVVGTAAFQATGSVKQQLLEKLKLRIDIDEVPHPDGRVLVVRVPPRPLGTPLHHDGRYLMRSGENLVPMTDDQLKTIHAEIETDFSATICFGARIGDLDEVAVERFRTAWIRKSRNESLRTLDETHLLSDAGLIVDGRLTHAAVILLASASATSRLLPNAEVVFEWRDGEQRIEYLDRRELRSGLFLLLDEVWETVNLRNTVQQFRDGLFTRDIATFNEAATREAILNAVAHRDYRAAGSVFIRQFPTSIEIESPGGFPRGVTSENILFRQVPRNRLLSETLAKVGLVERSGQGVDRMFETAIREGKEPPDFSRSDAYQVTVVLRGAVEDLTFLRFLEKLSAEGTYSIATTDLVVLGAVKRGQPIPEALRSRVARLIDDGLIERVGTGRGTRHILSKRFYEFIGTPAAYTRRRGLDRATNKELLVSHIRQNAPRGISFNELAQVLPSLSRDQVKVLLRELKDDGRIQIEGARRTAVWTVANRHL
jgi:ATP-dependent DNA helicase RecG